MKPPKLPAYTNAALPSAVTYGAGSLVYVTDWPNGGAVLMSDGARWRRSSPRRMPVADVLAGDEGLAIDWRARETLVNDYTDVLTGSGRPADLVTLTRASDATFFGHSGMLETVSSDVLRYVYDPSTRQARGLLIEGAATNLHTASEALNTWVSRSEMTVTADAATAPDGTTTADLLVPSTTSTTNHYVQNTQDISAASGTNYVGSVFVKAAGHNMVSLTFGTPNWGAQQPRMIVNLSDGSIVSTNASVIASKVTRLADGWLRIEMAATASSSFLTRMTIWVTNPNGSVTGFSGDGTSGIYAWGAQFEVGTIASSYIRTTSASATRAADSLVIGPDTFPVRTSGEATLYWRGRIRQRCNSGEGILLSANDNTSDEVVALREGASISGIDATVTEGGSLVADTASHPITAGNEVAVAVGMQAYGMMFYADGKEVATDWSMTAPTIDQLSITPGPGSIYEIDKIAYIGRARTASELAELSTV